MMQRWAIVFGSGFKTVVTHRQETGARAVFAAMYPEHKLVSIEPNNETYRAPIDMPPVVARKRNKRTRMRSV